MKTKKIFWTNIRSIHGLAAILMCLIRMEYGESAKMPEFPIEQDYLRFSPYAHPTVMYRASIFDTNEDMLRPKRHFAVKNYEIFMRLRRAGLKGANNTG